MLTALTTNVTRFFREPHHFEHLRSSVLTPFAQGKKIDRLRLWSAACSTGQEPYSIAAVVADTIPNAARMGIKILATDIDPTVIQHAQNGTYDSIDGVPPEMRRWFERDGGGWSVDPVLRSLITFKCLNLNAQWPVRGPFDVVFCRNVAIYFDHDVQARLWSSFAGVMPPGATFYIGHSERVSGTAAAVFENIGITTYRRRSAAL
jgi:chemotaxis protein methyltransferase CheR